MDRFKSNEDAEWAEGAFFEGGIAWTRKVPITNNPYEIGTWTYKSWAAGWADADMNSQDVDAS